MQVMPVPTTVRRIRDLLTGAVLCYQALRDTYGELLTAARPLSTLACLAVAFQRRRGHAVLRGGVFLGGVVGITTQPKPTVPSAGN
jgi:hypothetical protein